MNKNIIWIFVFILLFPLISSATFGFNSAEITIQTTSGELDDLTDVDVPSPTNNNVLTFNSTSGNWEDRSAAAVGDTNESTRFNNLVTTACGGSDFVDDVFANGTISCSTPSGSGNNSWNESHANTLYYSVTNPNNYLNTSTGDNESWNESHATSLYILQSNEGSLNVNQSDFWDNFNTANTTQFGTGSVLNILPSWLQSFILGIDNLFNVNSSNRWDNLDVPTDLNNRLILTEANISDLLHTTAGNLSWNESHANTLYYSISNPNNFINTSGGDNESWNESYANTLYPLNSSLQAVFDNYYLLSNPSSYFNSTTLVEANLNVNSSNFWDNLNIPTDLNSRIVLTEANISDLIHTTDTNESTRFGNLVSFDCAGTDRMTGNFANGTPVCNATAGSGDITAVRGDNLYVYNGSESGIVQLLFNETKLNATINSLGAGDNASWNQSHATGLYYLITNPSGYFNLSDFNIADFYLLSNPSSYFNSTTLVEANLNVNSSNFWDNFNIPTDLNNRLILTEANISDLLHTINTQKNASDFYLFNNSFTIFFNETHLNQTINNLGAGDNVSWNQSHATTLYYSVTNPNNYLNTSAGDNESWNESHANTRYILQSNEGNLNVNSSNFWDNINSFNVTQMSVVSTLLTISESWIQTFILSIDNLFNVNSSDRWDNLNIPTDLNSRIVLTEANISDLLHTTDTQKNASDFYLFNNSVTISFNETHLNQTISNLGAGDNVSWNESHANTLYYSVTNPNNYLNTSAGDNESWNESHANTLYVITELDPSWTANLTSGVTANLTGNTNATRGLGQFDLWWRNIFSVLGRITNFTSSNIITDNISSQDWTNVTLTESQITNLAHTSLTNVAFTNESNTFTPSQTMNSNLTVEGIRLEVDVVNHFIFDNATCTIIRGDTSRLEIC